MLKMMDKQIGLFTKRLILELLQELQATPELN